MVYILLKPLKPSLFKQEDITCCLNSQYYPVMVFTKICILQRFLISQFPPVICQEKIQDEDFLVGEHCYYYYYQFFIDVEIVTVPKN